MLVCFITNIWEDLNPERDSTLRLVHEAAIRGHTVGILYPRNLAIRGNVTMGFCKMLERKSHWSESIPVFYRQATFKNQRLPLKGFDVIVLRKEPPLDELMLNFLDSVKDDTFIVNDIDGLRKASSKIYCTSFDDSHNIVPETHVTKNKEYLLSVINESPREKWILKPINGYGGKGVIVLEKRARQNINSLLDFYVEGKESKNYVILQEYVEGAEGGDVRVLMLNGEPIGAMRRIPPAGDIRANVHVGGKVRRHTLTRKELQLCESIGPQLVADGLYFAGVDLIGGKLLEVNVMNPGGIVNIGRLNKVRLQKKVLDFFEKRHFRREQAVLQKMTFRKTVENA